MAVNDPQRETLLRTIENTSELAGRFDDIRRMGDDGGDGHFSLVLTAHDRTSNSRVVLKFFNPSHMRDQYRWNCFRREPTILQMFSGKPDILQCLFGHDEFTVPFTHMGMTLDVPFAYYAVELAARDMNSVILSDAWTAVQKLQAFRAMCRAVQRIHAKSVVHRDLKPSNFLVMPDRSIRLSDFGTARDVSDLDGSLLASYAAPPGDIRYASPEMLAAIHDVDPSVAFFADVYSLGAILFELFARTPLVLLVFDVPTLGALQQSMSAVDRGARVRIYHELIRHVSNSRPLPTLAHFTDKLPEDVLAPIDRLYQRLAALDYRVRLTNFGEVFSLINTAMWVLRHEDAYRRQKVFRERILEAKERKRLAIQSKGFGLT
jgi:serine/threonine protein kinase